MFFVISGYLITSTTMRRYGSLAQADVPSFYAFRFARIVPCLVLALALIVGLGPSRIQALELTEKYQAFLGG